MTDRNEVQQQDCEAMEKVVTEKEHFFPWIYTHKPTTRKGSFHYFEFSFDETEEQAIAAKIVIAPSGNSHAYYYLDSEGGYWKMHEIPKEDYRKPNDDAAAILQAVEAILMREYHEEVKRNCRLQGGTK